MTFIGILKGIIYKLINILFTSLKTLEKVVEIGKKAGLEYVYQGNVGEGENTFFPNCGKLLIKRAGFNLIRNKIKNDRCPYCEKTIAGIGMYEERCNYERKTSC